MGKGRPAKMTAADLPSDDAIWTEQLGPWEWSRILHGDCVRLKLMLFERGWGWAKPSRRGYPSTLVSAPCADCGKPFSPEAGQKHRRCASCEEAKRPPVDPSVLLCREEWAKRKDRILARYTVTPAVHEQVQAAVNAPVRTRDIEEYLRTGQAA